MVAPDERREFSRVEGPLTVEVEPREGGAFVAPAADLSLGGVRLCCSERPPLGAWVDVLLRPQSDGAQALPNLSAVVVRHTSDGIALCFLQMPEGSYDRMRALVVALSEAPGATS